MRQYIDLVEKMSSTDDVSSLLFTISDWLNGDAMHLINDDGEKFSAKPYYHAMEKISALVTPTRLNSLPAMIYRGVGFNSMSEFTKNKTKTAKKVFQSWTTSPRIADEFAKDYGGEFGVVFSAEVARNKKAIILSIADVSDWLEANRGSISHYDDLRYTFSRFESQDEIIIKGQMKLANAEVVKKPRTKKIKDTVFTNSK